jgi:hypothetical protein
MLILAVVGMFALATWHEAKVHFHDADHVVTIDKNHHDAAPDTPDDNDNTDSMHLSVHAGLQFVVVPAPTILVAAIAPAISTWTLALSTLNRTLAPASILRPPRS